MKCEMGSDATLSSVGHEQSSWSIDTHTRVEQIAQAIA